ncbi:poly alpha-glucosyltransferase, partial [Acinetobacter baumannii]|uniref:poly alpha-glucosyltransferase n=1 Tax=Acinetobacter baumannii TaxID=470 RepID=UPI0022217AB2
MTAFLNFQRQLNLWLEHIAPHASAFQDETILFISYGPKDQRCNVWHSEKTSFSQAKIQLLAFINDQFAHESLVDYIKIDVAYNLTKQVWKVVEQQVHHQFHNNHYRKGIGFDEHCSVVFLEQEIYGKAIIRGLSYDKPNFFDETNLNYAIKQKYRAAKPEIRLQSLQEVWTFDTYATFYENGQFINLASRYDANGIRAIASNKKQHFRDLIEKNAAFLHSQIQENGKFIYGYFPAYDRDIRNYNTVRHCTSLYALLETFEVQDKSEYWPKIVAAIQYALTTFYKEKDPITAFMIDGKEGELEIKLGANAAAILMLTKYQEITGKDDYLKYAEKLAHGILELVDPDGLTTHVLNYPNYDLKEKFRIIYYDGEAALALLRLYQINHDKRLLETVKLMFENFIHKRYEKY